LSPVRAPLLVAALALFAVAACATSAVAPTPPDSAPVASAPAPTPIPTQATEPTAAPSPTPPATPVDQGNVEGDSFPELSVETIDAGTLRVTLQDPEARAWRLVVAGTGDREFDKLRIDVVTSDVEAVVTVDEIVDSEVVSTTDLTGYGRTSAAGGCHSTLGVCFGSDGIRLPRNDDGRLAVRLSVADATGPLAITGSTAGWPGEPFILGPWVQTETFDWPS
jgi:hypothetical protein